MSERELQAVEDFKVIRPGFGSITWLEPTDVRGLALNSIITIEKKVKVNEIGVI